jgi:uncharacterized membrane protein
MRTIEEYLTELEAALRVRGAVRRRFLRECRDHLADAAADRGASQALRDFGPPSEIAAEFDTEVAARRGVRSTAVSVAAVLATGGSTLELIHAATTDGAAPAWAVVGFFVAAQIAAVAAGLALVQALVLRRSAMSPAELVLLSRRNTCALLAAGVTMFCAGAAAPGHASAAALLAGPALAAFAIVRVFRARSLARRLDGSGVLAVRLPLEDIARLTRLPLPQVDNRHLVPAVASLAAAAAFVRDRAEHASAGAALIAAGVEAAAVVACFLMLGPALGIRAARPRHLP